MADTKELLAKIAALRLRLNTGAESAQASATTSAQDPLRAVADKVQRGAQQQALIEGSLRAVEPSEPAQMNPTTMRLTGRGARLLRKGREMLQALRKVSNDAEYQDTDDADVLVDLHREAMAMLEVLLRTAQTFPPTVSVQLRMCDGLEVVLAEIEDRLDLLCSILLQRKQTSARINELADYLRALARKQLVGLAPLQALADGILAEAQAGAPLKFLYASPAEPARFAAAHSLTVAQVMARILMDDAEWQPQLQLALMAALVHDVGMARMPAEVLLTQAPLDADERRLIEKHTTAAPAILANLWPGGGWPIEAARDHHERNDGTGYPEGKRDLQLSPYVRVLAVCDVYAALGAPRPHRPAFDTRTALTETLMLAERDYLDRPSAERLLLLSFYPVGSAVELNDGAIALVTATHPGSLGMANPARPIVQIVLDPQGQPMAWPTTVDLLKEKERAIVRGLRADERKAHLGKQFPHACV